METWDKLRSGRIKAGKITPAEEKTERKRKNENKIEKKKEKIKREKKPDITEARFPYYATWGSFTWSKMWEEKSLPNLSYSVSVKVAKLTEHKKGKQIQIYMYRK